MGQGFQQSEHSVIVAMFEGEAGFLEERSRIRAPRERWDDRNTQEQPDDYGPTRPRGLEEAIAGVPGTERFQQNAPKPQARTSDFP